MLDDPIKYGLLAALAIALLVAAYTDFRHRTISNWLSGAIALAAPLFWWANGLSLWPEVALQLGVGVATFAVLAGLFALRAMGGGDVKLLAAFGAWLGPALVCWVAVYGAIAGGALALPLVLWRGRLRTTIANMWGIVTHWRLSGLKPHPVVTLDNPDAVRMPYALPIALGALATLWLRVW
jgi:prepilin peptidase CpaA